MPSHPNPRAPSPTAIQRRLIAALLGAALGVPAAPLGWQRRALAQDPQPEDATTAEAQALYREGQNFYETANYKKAIEKWTQAYGLLDWGPANAEAKTSLLYNLASAHEKEFGISANVQNLRTARVLLQSFAQRIPTIYGEGTAEANAELDRVEHRIAELDKAIEDASGTGVPVDVPDEEATDASDAQTEANSDGDPTPNERDASNEPPTWGKPVFYSGAAAIGLGLAAGGGAIAFMILSDQQNDFDDIDPTDLEKRADRVDKGLLYNDLAVGLGVTGGVLVVGGIVLALVGKKRMAKEASGTASLDGLAPYVGADGRAGLTLTGHF